jgi:RNA-directed DNA polymerase
VSIFDDTEDIFVSTQILFHHSKGRRGLHLEIGAPSSPCLSNIIMYKFDMIVSDLVAHDGVTYTRYADDLTFSAKRTGFLTGVEKMLRRVIRETTSPCLAINEEKTVLATRKYKRMMTGLILTNDGDASLGHERKKEYVLRFTTLSRANLLRQRWHVSEASWLSCVTSSPSFFIV